MAVLAPPDWQQLYPSRENTMDVPTTNSVNNSRQRLSPANDNQHHPAQHQHQQQHTAQHQQPYPYPVQQQPQGSWTPSIAAAPFYPSFYQNHQQPQSPQPYPNQIPQQPPYFDPANAQLAQWAYQQMMFNAQHGFPPQQRNAAANDYFAQNQIPPAFNPFPSGTPPPHQNHRGGAGDHQQQQGQLGGFHPYRRPSRQPQQHSPDGSDWRPGAAGPPQPPYGRPEASGSTSSVNSSHSHRQRTNSNQSGQSGHNNPSSANGSARGRNISPSVPSPNRNSPSPVSSSGSSPAGQLRIPHHRNSSSSSSGSATRPSGISPSPSSSTTTTSPAIASPIPASTSAPVPTPRPARPSPLSQGNFTATERRMSRDDSDPMLDPTPSASMLRSGGLKGRLRRALSFNAAQALKEEEASDDESIKASTYSSSSKLKAKTPAVINPAVGKAGGGGGVAPVRGSTDGGVDDSASTATVQTKKKGRAASLFNSRLNASTDNISLSSTVSSASVMIRKLGSMGRLARRNSLAGITSLFKDKDKNKDGDKDGKGKKKDKDAKKGSAKAEASEASVSHVTAELDRTAGDWTAGADMNGLSPAAKLARQHTLKTNAEAAARVKAQQEAAAAAVSDPKVNGVNGAGVPTWDRNTATRQGSVSPVKGGGMRVNEDGTRVLVEDEDEESDDGHYGGPHQPGHGFHDGWDEDEDWEGDADGDEDVTIRVGLERTSMDDDGYAALEDPEPWAVDVRRSVEKARRPAKGILKYAESYDQLIYLAEHPTPNRLRSNSYNSHPGQSSELGPLARIPSPDPDHIDGLHRHHPHSPTASPTAPSLPPLSFDSSTSMSLDSPKEPDTPTNATHVLAPLAPHHPEKSNAIFQHPNLNSSAPALSTMGSSPVMLTHRSATAPSKRLAFASNLSVYDTFPASVYDRRSEPATWSRLTPALAQRIKEELNSYKMEEMEVHAASRIHTQFFV
ncbi:hypothetical protein Hypma_008207 [Hypsizygus marmoreus]|uniref:Protein BNI4 n=1 Tax=Hypsizygus marmoreus TaxID=39966 RepID=A0A369JQW0_HYPMA|nr:hypothetical protein Hypma_008207 [Hypsizygus marmoreus]